MVAAGPHQVWVRDIAATVDRGLDPLLVLHGFPSCSFDWRHVLERMRSERRVVLLDFIGFGLSDKPDLRYGLRVQADVVEAVAAHLGLAECRPRDPRHGRLGRGRAARPRPRRQPRVLGRADACSPTARSTSTWRTSRRDSTPCSLCPTSATSSSAPTTASRSGAVWRPRSRAGHPADDVELDCQWLLLARQDGHALHAAHHPLHRGPAGRGAALHRGDRVPSVTAWCGVGSRRPDRSSRHDRPVDRGARPDAELITLDGVGHYPMIEAPEQFADAVMQLLDQSR